MLRVLPKISLLILASLVISIACTAITKTPPASAGKVAGASSSRQEEQEQAAPPAPAQLNPGEKMRVMVISVRTEINDPILFVLRRGLKEAEDNNINTVILDMKTPGGGVSTALDMMEMLGRFPGTTITYVNDEAISAGSLIAAATNEIWFAPGAVIGAAAGVNSDGTDIPETMRLKLNSFLRAKVRAVTGGKEFRGEVVSAMIDRDFELKIDGQLLKPKGELLSLTDTEAMKTYGDPSHPLLGAGIAPTIEDLLHQKYGPGNFEITRLEVTWSEQLAQWLNLRIVQILLIGLGLIALFIEFKTPGFGVFGVTGIVLLAIVFLSSYVAGLSGHEPMIIFAIGILLIIGELILHPGLIFPIITGLILALGALVWAMTDIWPSDPVSVAWSTNALVSPLLNLAIGLVIAVALIVALLRYMPKSWFWDRLVLSAAIGGAAQVAGLSPDEALTLETLMGKQGVVLTPLRPFGQIEIDGRHYEARFPLGTADVGARVIVRGHTDFSLEVEPVDPVEENKK